MKTKTYTMPLTKITEGITNMNVSEIVMLIMFYIYSTITYHQYIILHSCDVAQ